METIKRFFRRNYADFRLGLATLGEELGKLIERMTHRHHPRPA